MDKDDYYLNLKSFEKLPGEITHLDADSFYNVLKSPAAMKLRGIVYLWRCEKDIPRLKGGSNIIYIGQTKNNIYGRYHNYARYIHTKANSHKLGTILENYGPISVHIHEYTKFGPSLLKAEGQLLWWYFQNHCEYPPINYTQTRIRNDSL